MNLNDIPSSWANLSIYDKNLNAYEIADRHFFRLFQRHVSATSQKRLMPLFDHR